MNRTKLITMMAMLTAIGVVGSQFVWFPAGVARAYPVQHAVNVVAAVMLGPLPAIGVAFMIALVRNLLGIGTLLAFPGSMIGAFLAGVLYKKTSRLSLAAAGEVAGTGLIGALTAVPVAKVLMGTAFAAWFFIPPFLISSLSGALLGWLLLARLNQSTYTQLQ
ncbi:energy coupling factor transporter S component ThiW [Jeotgalibacillus sp. R-1-5s-1]|uniref:energy coupling factor transporter S component ThiW n=1 Tax=Jeotgalibacillus sp. R-1-5s-1 TaxID=2555897 RepID=UPI00106A0195|nr:energy coupling factor transporter S component ThiW [Jeotgalibacillus sp. R-1-5s-1]TFE00037.1 energy coupling factor transporter S component ThiW [Jeotgalibacillus sp. R-1-5s-1]